MFLPYRARPCVIRALDRGILTVTTVLQPPLVIFVLVGDVVKNGRLLTIYVSVVLELSPSFIN